MRRRLIATASAAAFVLSLGIGAAGTASGESLPLCQFADSDEARNGNCVVGDVAADGVTVINPDGPVYGDATTP